MILEGVNEEKVLGQQQIEREFKPLSSKEIKLIAKQMGENKNVLPEFEKTIYHTLAYFPELQKAHIKFKYGKISTTLNARPTIGSLFFRKRENRRYVVRINSAKKENCIQLSNVAYNAQIGVLAHEFSHFIDYFRKRGLGDF